MAFSKVFGVYYSSLYHSSTMPFYLSVHLLLPVLYGFFLHLHKSSLPCILIFLNSTFYDPLLVSRISTSGCHQYLYFWNLFFFKFTNMLRSETFNFTIFSLLFFEQKRGNSLSYQSNFKERIVQKFMSSKMLGMFNKINLKSN